MATMSPHGSIHQFGNSIGRTLIAEVGLLTVLARLAERLRCPRCGSRRIAAIYDPLAGVRRVQASGSRLEVSFCLARGSSRLVPRFRSS